ncbi:MAG: ATP-binding cassette domain-containing protein [Cyanobacteria bacterium J06597_16]
MADRFQQLTVVAATPTLELNNAGQIVRFELFEDIHRLGRDADWSDLSAGITGWSVISRRQATLKREGKGYRIFDGDGQTTSRNGMFVNQVRINATEGYLLLEGTQLQIGLSPENRILVTYRGAASLTQRPKTVPSMRRLTLSGLQDEPVELGRAPTPNRYASMTLDAPTVSRVHAKIWTNGSSGHTLQDSSTNGTFLNGQRIDRRCPLKDGDLIRLGPFTLSYHPDHLLLEDTGSQIRLDAHRLIKQVKDKQGNEKKILNDISLVIEPGQLVALVGGSGAGKSTLMKSLLSISPVTTGAVFLNGENLRDSWGLYRTQIGYVPQDDIIHYQLTVEEVLTYACTLRLPPDTDVAEVVSKTLSQIKLSHVRHTLVRNLSGGQRKRVSIGVELLADPKLFFLDEPTSGLDPGLDKEMMRLLRDLADQGRTIVLVTHATANIDVCDRIVFLGRGGYLCYFGPPQAAPDFFGLPRGQDQDFADIYLTLEGGDNEATNRDTVNAWCAKYRQSPAYKTYVSSLLSPGQNQSSSTLDQATDRGHDRVSKGVSFWGQLSLLSQRYLKLTLRDRLSQILTLISGPVALALTGIILSSETPLAPLAELTAGQAPLALRLVFVFSCIAIWVGLSSAVREIVKEAAIYSRERLINLGLFAYLGSKMLIWLGIAALQSVLMVAVVLLAFEPPASALIPWGLGLGITNFLTILASVSLSLTISSLVKTENAANNLLPLIMIPQIIFSGVLFELSGISQQLSWLMISRWSVGAYGSLVDINAMVPEPVTLPDGNMLEQVFSTTATYDATWGNLALSWGVLCLHILLYLSATLWLQKRKDIL